MNNKLEYRKEYKFVFNSLQAKNFINHLSNQLTNLYPQRKIKSLYFDTTDFLLFKNSEINDINKEKVRIRQYNNSGPFYQEVKFNYPNGKGKKVEKLAISNFNEVNKIKFKKLILYPAAYISYLRNYYLYNGSRLTIDYSIEFFSHDHRRIHPLNLKNKNTIFELKLEKNDSEIEKLFIHPPVAFSKYNTAIKTLYNI